MKYKSKKEIKKALQLYEDQDLTYIITSDKLLVSYNNIKTPYLMLRFLSIEINKIINIITNVSRFYFSFIYIVKVFAF